MAKVKKGTALTGVRNVKASKTTAARTSTPARAAGAKGDSVKSGRAAGAKSATVRSGKKPAPATPASRGKAPKRTPAVKKTAPVKPATRKVTVKTRSTKTTTKSKAALKLMSTRGRRPVAPPPVVRVAVRELDPQRKCGPGTSVQFLYRVDETVDGRSTAHLVFFDRHGWYCEHGRNCPAVGHARKHNGQFARVS